jgi:hypothetical protein
METADTPAVIAARAAVTEAAAKLQTIKSGIAFARANPSEVSKAEVADLVIRANAACELVEKLVRIYDRAVARAERSA